MPTAKLTTIDTLTGDEPVGKIIPTPNRVYWTRGDRLEARPSASGLISSNSYQDVTLSGDRLYALTTTGTILWFRLGSTTSTIVKVTTSSALSLHVDDANLYFTSRIGDEGTVYRYGRDYESSGGSPDHPVPLATGPVTGYFGGTRTRLYGLTRANDGIEKSVGIFRADKPAGANVTNLGGWTEASPYGFHVDDGGMVVLLRSDQDATDNVVSLSLDMSSQAPLASAPSGKLAGLAVDATHAYFTNHDNTIERAPRDGSTPSETLLTTTCRITALAVDTEAVYFATSGPQRKLTVWRLAK